MRVTTEVDRIDDGVLVTLENEGGTVPGFGEARAALEDVDGVEVVEEDPFILPGGLEDGVERAVLRYDDVDRLDEARDAVMKRADGLFREVGGDAEDVQALAAALPSSFSLEERGSQ